MIVTFRTVRYKNLLATGNTFTEVALNDVLSTLILGANGQGKSTILDALCFGLFKKPFRKIAKLQLLVNTVNNKDLVVEIEFQVGSHEYLVRRGLKPAIFELYQNGALMSQDARTDDYQIRLEKIIGLSYESFKQVAILGSASYTPFMQLKTPERREFIEQLLDIQIFSRMNEVLKERVSADKKELVDVLARIAGTEEQLALVKGFIAKLNSDQQKESKENQNTIETESTLLSLDLEARLALAGPLRETQESMADLEQVTRAISDLQEKRAEARSRLRAIEEQIAFYQGNTTCDQCRQNIDSDHKSLIVSDLDNKKLKFANAMTRLDGKIETKKERLAEIQIIKKRRSELEQESYRLTSVIQSRQRYINTLQQRVTATPRGSVGEEETKLANLEARLHALQSSRDDLFDRREVLDITTLLLKDSGIKASVIRQFVPIITRLANKFLSVQDFFVSFSLDEHFEETFKARHRDTLTYYSFSEGEKKRIDVALLFTMREIARLKNSAATNILFLDEVLDSSLDEMGMESMMRLIRDSGGPTNVFVISHRGHGLADKFDRVISFQKEGLFSKLEKIAA